MPHARNPIRRSIGGAAPCTCHPPLCPHPAIPYHHPMPTDRTRPPTPRRSCESRACPGEGRGTSLSHPRPMWRLFHAPFGAAPVPYLDLISRLFRAAFVLCLRRADRTRRRATTSNLRPSLRGPDDNTNPIWPRAGRGTTDNQPQSCFGPPPRDPRHGRAGKNRARRNESTRIGPPPLLRQRPTEARGGACKGGWPPQNECRPGCSPGRHGGRRGPDHSGHGDPALLSRRSSGWQASAGRRGVYARTEAGLCLTPGPTPQGPQPAGPGPAPAHC